MKHTPCPSCPWRVSTRTADIPGGGMDHARAALAMHDSPRGKVMACHLSTDEKPYGCAGFIARVGTDSFAVRLAMAFGALDLAEYGDGGAELHPTMAAMLAAHPPRRCGRRADTLQRSARRE